MDYLTNVIWLHGAVLNSDKTEVTVFGTSTRIWSPEHLSSWHEQESWCHSFRQNHFSRSQGKCEIRNWLFILLHFPRKIFLNNKFMCTVFQKTPTYYISELIFIIFGRQNPEWIWHKWFCIAHNTWEMSPHYLVKCSDRFLDQSYIVPPLKTGWLWKQVSFYVV